MKLCILTALCLLICLTSAISNLTQLRHDRYGYGGYSYSSERASSSDSESSESDSSSDEDKCQASINTLKTCEDKCDKSEFLLKTCPSDDKCPAASDILNTCSDKCDRSKAILTSCSDKCQTSEDILVTCSDKCNRAKSLLESCSEGEECDDAEVILNGCIDKCARGRAIVESCDDKCSISATILETCEDPDKCPAAQTILGTCGDKCSISATILGTCDNKCTFCSAMCPPATCTEPTNKPVLFVANDVTIDNFNKMQNLQKEVLSCECKTGYKIKITSTIPAGKTTINDADSSKYLTYSLSSQNGCPDLCIRAKKAGGSAVFWVPSDPSKDVKLLIASKCEAGGINCINYGGLHPGSGNLKMNGPPGTQFTDSDPKISQENMTPTSKYLQVEAVSCHGCGPICVGNTNGCSAVTSTCS